MSRYDFILAKPSAVRHLRACFHQFKSFITTSRNIIDTVAGPRAQLHQWIKSAGIAPLVEIPCPLFKDLRPASAKGAPMSMN